MQEAFEFRASLTQLEQGLDLIHGSLDRLREATGRSPDDPALMLFEIAMAEIGGNVLTHGRPPSSSWPVEFVLRYEAGTLEAEFADRGPEVKDPKALEMPDQDREEGRGLVIARSVLDEFGYERDGDVNRWRLVKRL